MNLFLDTSTLVKLYHEEEGTHEIDNFIKTHKVENFYISEITSLEFTSAVYRKMRMKEISPDQAENLLTLFSNDLANYFIIRVDSQLINKAAELLETHRERNLRTLDAIQLACMLIGRDTINVAMSNDQRLLEIMKLEGIRTQ